MSIINKDNYTLRWGYEVHSNGNNNTIFDLTYGSYGSIPNILTDGVTWPNYRFGKTDFSISDSLVQNNDYCNVYKVLNYSNALSLAGTRTSFTLQCLASGLDQIAIFITPTTFLNDTYVRVFDIVQETNFNFLNYDSLSNSYSMPNVQVNSTPTSFPDLNSLNGQIYFRIEENGDVYSSRDKSTASFICNLTYQTYNIYIMVKGYSGSKSCLYNFIQNNTVLQVNNPITDQNILQTPMFNKTASLTLPSGNNIDTSPCTISGALTVISPPPVLDES